MKNESITVILGAGFSKPAGLPLANEINVFFDRDNRNNLLSFSSGEHLWYEFANATYRNNGRLSDEFLMWGYILNQLVEDYKSQNGIFDNYENFYQFVLDLLKDREKLELLFKSAQETAEKTNDYFSKTNPNYKNNIYNFINKPRSEIKSFINDLVGDLLFVRRNRETFIEAYYPFILKIKSYSKIDFITLNHDLLLETILKRELNINYSDGFSRNQKLLFEGKTPLNVFENDFKGPISVIKLHGSIDIYRYDFYHEKGSLASLTNEYRYYKTMSFSEKQSPKRHDPKTGKIVQTFHKEISPQFITGTRKEEIIESDKMYADLYYQFDKRIHSNQELLIIGYSFADKHLNERIVSALNSGIVKKIINVNPGLDFPFDVELMKIEVLNLKDIKEIK